MSKPRTGMRSDLARVRHLGAAGSGVEHWWLQRVTAVALVPLTLWLVAGVVAHVDADHTAVRAWLGSPFTFGLMAALIGVTFFHAQLGLRVVVEDYVGNEGLKTAAMLLVGFTNLSLGLTSMVALLVIAFGH